VSRAPRSRTPFSLAKRPAMKKLALTAIASILLLLGSIFLLYTNLNAILPSLKGDLEAYASQALGVPIRFRSVVPSFFPSVTLSVKGIDIGEGRDGAVYFPEAQVGLDILPLLLKQISVSEVALVEPTLTIIKDGWAVRLLRRKISPRGKSTPPDADVTSSGITLDSVSIRKGTVTYKDDLKRTSVSLDLDGIVALEREGTRYEIRTDVSAKTREQAAPITLSSHGLAIDSEQGTIEGEIELRSFGGDAVVKLALAHSILGGDIRFASSSLDLEAFLPLLREMTGMEPLTQLKGRLEGDITMTLPATRDGESLASGGFQIVDGEVEWDGTRVRDLTTKVYLSNGKRGAEALFSTLTGKVAAEGMSELEVAFEAPNTFLPLKTSKLVVPAGVASVNGDEVRFSAEIEPLLHRLEYSLESARLSNSTLLAFAPALRPLNPEGNYSLKLQGEFDKTGRRRMHGDVGLINGVITVEEQKFSAMNAVLQVSERDGKFFVDSRDLSLMVNGVPLSLRGRTIFTGDEIKPLSLDASLLGGEVKVNGSTDLNAKLFEISGALRKIPLDELLPLLNINGGNLLKGTISKLDGKLHGSLGLLFQEKLVGPVKFELIQGEFKGINITREVLAKARALPLWTGRMRSQIPAEFRPILAADSTRFESLGARLYIEEGKARIDDINIQSSLFSLKGSGETSLVDGSLKLHSTLRFSRPFAEALLTRAPLPRQELDEMVLSLTLSRAPPRIPNATNEWQVEVGGPDTHGERTTDIGVAKALEQE